MTGSLRHSTGAMVAGYTTLTDTSATDVYTARKGGGIINEVVISNPTGSTVTIVVDVYDGTNVMLELEPGNALAAASVMKLNIDGWPISAGQTLRVTGANLVQVGVSSYQSIYEYNQN